MTLEQRVVKLRQALDEMDFYVGTVPKDAVIAAALREAVADVQAERDGWHKAWQQLCNAAAGRPGQEAERLADDIITVLTLWKEKQPPHGPLLVVWPVDREALAALIQSSLAGVAARGRESIGV